MKNYILLINLQYFHGEIKENMMKIQLEMILMFKIILMN